MRRLPRRLALGWGALCIVSGIYDILTSGVPLRGLVFLLVTTPLSVLFVWGVTTLLVRPFVYVGDWMEDVRGKGRGQ